jgi:dihydropteroate synthase
MAFQRRKYLLRLPDRILELGSRTAIMGVLNATPDSFSDGGLHLDADKAVRRAWEIAEEGADILDVGGESTRPGSHPVSATEEMRRVMPVLERLHGSYPLPISIDTSKPEVAHAALKHGAGILNDVTGLRADSALASAAAVHGAALIVVHMRGEPATMQLQPPSADILREIDSWAGKAVATALSCGVSRDRIVLDPGIGFGKTAGQNLKILRNMERMSAIGFPLLVGTSRKSFIGAILRKPPSERIWGTAAAVAASVAFGAHIVRVHDVAAMREVVQVMDAIMVEETGE